MFRADLGGGYGGIRSPGPSETAVPWTRISLSSGTADDGHLHGMRPHEYYEHKYYEHTHQHRECNKQIPV